MRAMRHGLVSLGVGSGIARITLNRPERHNSLIPELLDDLIEATGTVAATREIHVAVLAGMGRSFSTGGDIRAFFERGDDLVDYAHRIVGRLNDAILSLMDLPIPLIGRVHGPVTGGSLGLVLACDLVAATPQAFFAPYYVDVGFSPDGGWTAILPDRIGWGRAGEIQLLNRQLGADEALALGLVTKVVESAGLDDQIGRWVETLNAKVAGSLAATKARLLPPARRALYRDGLECERRAFVERIAAPETRAGMARFLGIPA